MSKSVRRRSLRLESQFNNSSPTVNNKTRTPKNVTNTQIKNSLMNRSKLDVQFSKANKSKNGPNQRMYQSLFRNGSLFGSEDSSEMQVFPNVSNPIQQVDLNRSSNVSPSILAPIAEVSATEKGSCRQDSPDTSSTFYEPDSTVGDDDLETDLLIDSNGPISNNVLIENTKMNIPIYNEASLKHKTSNETSQTNVSVKKLTQFKPVSVKTNALRIGKPVVVKKVKSAVQRRTQANSSQHSLFDEFKNIQAVCSTHRNATKKNASSSKAATMAATLINEKVLPTKYPDLKKLSQHRLQTPTLCSPAVNAKLSSCKSKPMNSPRIRKNPPTPKPKSQPKCVSPEIFASDYDSNQPNSSSDMVLPTPSPPDLTKLDHSLSGNRLVTLQDTNSYLNTPVTNSTHHLEKTSRYPLRHMSTASPVIYDLPVTHRRRSNSLLNFDNSSSQNSTNVKFKSKPAAKKTAAPKPLTKVPLQFSQCSSVHESLLNVNTPQETLSDVYNFVSNSPPTKRQTRTKKKPRAPSSKSTSTTKTTHQCKLSGNNLLFSTLAAGESAKVVSSRKTNTKPRTNVIRNSKSTAELTNNNTPKKVNTNLPRNDKNTEGNFLNSLFPQRSQEPSQLSSFFNTRNSQASQIFNNSNISLNSQMFFNRTPAISFQSQRNHNQAYGSMLAYIDSINHNNSDIEMQELCDLFSLLKISDERDRISSFLTYRDPCHAFEKPLRTRRIDAICKKPRKLSFFGNTFMNYRQSSNTAVEENEIPFTPIPPKNGTSIETNFHQFEYANGTPVVSSDATNDTHLSAREILKGITTISTKLPHYFYADGEYNFDGFSNWK